MISRSRRQYVLWLVVHLVSLALSETASAGNAPSFPSGFTPSQNFVKVVISRPDASAPLYISPVASAGGRIVDEYDISALAYVPSVATEKLISTLNRLGVEVSPRDYYDQVFLPGGIIDTRFGVEHSNPGKALSPVYGEEETGLFIMQFAGPIREVWRKDLAAMGVTFVQYVPYNAYIVAAPTKVARSASRYPFVQFVDVMHAFLKPQVRRVPTEVRDIYLQLANVPGVALAAKYIGALAHGTVERTDYPDEVRLRGQFNGDEIEKIAAHPLVFGIADVPRFDFSDERVAMSVTRNISQAGIPQKPPSYKAWLAELCPYCGTLLADKFAVAFADTGLDGGACAGSTHHSDLPLTRIRYGTSRDPADTLCSQTTTFKQNDTLGHGTGVVGVAAGDPPDGAQADAQTFLYGSGIAPSAGILMAKIDVTTADATPIATSASDARITATPNVYIQNHSYNQYQKTLPPPAVNPKCGDAGLVLYDGSYSIVSRDFDRAVRDANTTNATVDPITLTVSAGNQWQQPLEYAPCTDRRLALPPATAKNVIAVGATENARPATQQWVCTSDPRVMPARAESFNNIEADSKRGTLNPNWYKPDIMAPASLITIQRAVGDAAAQFCPSISVTEVGPYYQFATGTSFAAPEAAGAALLASRAYAERLQPNCHQSGNCSPGAASPALLKAILVMGARTMQGGEDRAMAPLWRPNKDYGVGAVIEPVVGNGHTYIATTAGTSAGQLSEEPSWPATGSVSDNTVVWAAHGSTLIGAIPNGQQGFGRLHLEDILSDYPARDFVNESFPLTSQSSWEGRTYQVHDPKLPVKVVLAWTDLPALQSGSATVSTSPLLNNLDLEVDVGLPCTVRYNGNQLSVLDTSKGEESSPRDCTSVVHDTTNNVEVVRFFASANGVTQFKVRVKASELGEPQTFALVVLNAYDISNAAPPNTPTNFGATAVSSTEVSLSWTAVANALSYDVQRKTDGHPFVSMPTLGTSPSADTGLTSGRGYAYRVRARNAAGVSGWTTDFSVTQIFTDPSLVAGVVKASHIVELRQAIDAARAAVGLGPYTYAGSVNTGTIIQATQINQLRQALDEARSVVNLEPAVYIDNSLFPGTTKVKAVHIQQLRDGVK